MDTLTRIIYWIDNDIHPHRLDLARKYLRRILLAFGLLLVPLVLGISGFMLIEGYNLLDAVYMTVITVSTVGFEEVHPLSKAGRVFATILIIVSLGIVTYSLSTLSTFIFEGKFKRMVTDLLVGRKIDKMKDHIIICGYGRYGSSVVKHLAGQNKAMVIIESDLEKVQNLRASTDYVVLSGDATDEDLLREAGVEHASALITVMPKDAGNVYITLVARQMNPYIKIISRANQANSKKQLRRAGADHVIVPENVGGYYMSALITKPDIVEVFSEISSSETGRYRMAEVILNPLPDFLKGKHIGHLQIKEKSGANVIVLKGADGSFVVNPKEDTELTEGAALLVIGDDDQLDRFHELTKEFEFID